MRPYVRVGFLFAITIPPLVYFFTIYPDKDLAGVLLVVFGGFFVDRCLDIWDRQAVSREVKAIRKAVGGLSVGTEAALIWRIPLSNAFAYAEEQLEQATKMLNTSFSTRHGTATSAKYSKWTSAIAKAVVKRSCIVQEVVVSPDRARAVPDLLAGQTKPLAGSYAVADISSWFAKKPEPPFIDFVVFEYSQSKEVVFGWSTSPDFPANQDCFASSYPPLVAYFEAQFNRLEHLGPR
jgi:hypothetical protein